MSEAQQPIQPPSLTEAQIAHVADRALGVATEAGSPPPFAPAMGQLGAVLHAMQHQAIEPAPESLITRLIRLEAQTKLGQTLDRVADAVTGAVVEVIRSFLATLTYDSRITPALAGFRGSAGATQLAFSSDAGELHLHATESASSADSRVAVRGVFEPSAEFASTLEAALRAPSGGGSATISLASLDATAVVSTELDEDAMFVLRLAPGAYRGTIRIADVRIELGVLELP